MAFSDQFLDELRGRAGLVDIIGRKVKLTRKGREHQGLCPFHKEKTPSFTVNEEKGFYHCFGCQSHGSVFDFLMETEGLSFPEAVERLAGEAGMEVPTDTPQERERQKQRQTLLDVTEMAAAMFEKTLRMPEGKPALEYLYDRGLDDETISRFRLGFAPAGRNRLKTALARKGVDEGLSVAAGLLIQPERDHRDERDGGREPYDRFRGRVMFPIWDRRGRVIAFGGRILGDGEPKYLNSPETPLFHKGANLYGLHLASPAARKADTIIVTEGYMDVIALARAGISHGVAPLGTALTEDQVQILWKIIREPILCFDGDAAGQRAAAKAAERSLQHLKPGYGLRFAQLPSGEDPDTLITRQGVGAMHDILATALPLSEVLWQNESGGRIPSSAEARAALQARLDEHTRRIQDPTVRSHFSRLFSERLWPKAAGDEAGTRSGGNWKRKSAKDRGWTPNMHVGTGKSALRSPIEDDEIFLLAVIIYHPSSFDEIGERLGTMSFSAPDLDKIRLEVLKTLADNPGLETGALATHLIECDYGGPLGRIRELKSDPIVGPNASQEIALSEWNGRFRKLRNWELAKEIEEAKRANQANPSEAGRERLEILRDQKLALSEEEATGHVFR